jgi:hypothetical protein
VWDIRRLKVEEIGPLRLDDDALVEASRVIVRGIIENPPTFPLMTRPDAMESRATPR